MKLSYALVAGVFALSLGTAIILDAGCTKKAKTSRSQNCECDNCDCGDNCNC